jgi:collagen type III alpha
MVKRLLLFVVLLTTILSCSIDGLDPLAINGIDGKDGKDGTSVSITTQEVTGGTLLIIRNGDKETTVFIRNGKDGKDGIDGLNGLNGKDGKDGTSVSISTQTVTGGTILTIKNGDKEIVVFIRNGQDGTNGTNGTNGINGADGKDGKDGANGLPGINGKDGVSSTIRTEATQGGYNVYITVGGETKVIFIANGTNGTNGATGLNGADGKDGVTATVRTEDIVGGYVLIIKVGDKETRITILNGNNGTNGTNGINGTDGKDGTNGVDGLPGVNGKDGISSTIRTEKTEGGYNMYITVGGVTEVVFIGNGTDGTNGLDGKDGINGIPGVSGKDGVSSTIRTEKIVGGYILIITVGDKETRITIYDGIQGIKGLNGTSATITSLLVNPTKIKGDIHEFGGYYLIINVAGVTTTVFVSNGSNGNDGKDGKDGVDGIDSNGNVTICHRVTHPVADYPLWLPNTNVTLVLTLPQYIKHVYEYHNGNSTQNDSFGPCK